MGIEKITAIRPGRSLQLRRRPRYPAKQAAAEEPHAPKADPNAYPTAITLLGYDGTRTEERRNATIEDFRALRPACNVLWVDVVGLADIDRIQELGALLGLHPLALEDVVHTYQRAKFEDFGDYGFFIMRMAPLENERDTDQLSMFLGPDYVLTFQERPGDDLECVRNRIRAGKGRIRQAGPDYLAYSIIDAAVDAYFPYLERSGNELEDLEEIVTLKPNPEVMQNIYMARRRLLVLRRAVWPLRDAISSLSRDDVSHFAPETRVFLRDIYDHAIQLIDLLENYRELSANLMDTYLSAMSNRLNEVMKVLTIITTIFIPLSFVASLYGMNFTHDENRPWNMPELDWKYGYPVTLLVMALIAGVEIYYFRRKGWIGREKSSLGAGLTSDSHPSVTADSPGELPTLRDDSVHKAAASVCRSPVGAGAPGGGPVGGGRDGKGK